MHTDGRQYAWCLLTKVRISLARLDHFYCFKHNFDHFKGFKNYVLQIILNFYVRLLERIFYLRVHTGILIQL